MTSQHINLENFGMTPWHKKQAAMLYYFTSADYLRVLHRMVSDLISGFVDPLLEMATAQNRDRVLISKLWGNRNTSRNWENNAWPFLKDLQGSLANDIAQRASNRFRITAVSECLRGLSEYSTDWATENEEQLLKLALSAISEYASRFDRSVEEYVNRWNDYRFAYCYPFFARANAKVPRFIVRNEIQGETGKIPPRTGVYICLEDQQASLQFVWTEGVGAALRAANTFNEIGRAALAAVGREALWFDERKMFDFATSAPYATSFRDLVFLDGEPYPPLAPAAIARSAFVSRPCRWALVEIVADEFEELSSLASQNPTRAPEVRRVPGGARCDVAGVYLTPAAPGARLLDRKSVV